MMSEFAYSMLMSFMVSVMVTLPMAMILVRR